MKMITKQEKRGLPENETKGNVRMKMTTEHRKRKAEEQAFVKETGGKPVDETPAVPMTEDEDEDVSVKEESNDADEVMGLNLVTGDDFWSNWINKQGETDWTQGEKRMEKMYRGTTRVFGTIVRHNIVEVRVTVG